MEEQYEIASLRRRLERVERHNRWIKSMGTSLIALLFTSLMLGLGSSGDRLDTREILIRDSGGNPRVALAVSEDGSPGLVFWDGERRVRALLEIGNEGLPTFISYDLEGREKVVLAVEDIESRAGLPEEKTQKVYMEVTGKALVPKEPVDDS